MRGTLNISTEDAMNNFGQLMQAACHEILLTGVSNAVMTFFKRSSCLNWPMKTSVAKWNDLYNRSKQSTISQYQRSPPSPEYSYLKWLRQQKSVTTKQISDTHLQVEEN
jgi:hypothetical protein